MHAGVAIRHTSSRRQRNSGFHQQSKIIMNPSATIAIPKELVVALQQAKDVVVFTGAGVSAESGIPTFRDALTGLWERFDAERLATPDAFRKDKELVWGWYEWRRMKVLRSLPNPAHFAIAELARHRTQAHRRNAERRRSA
jgi:hypothetical protein